MVLKLYDRGPEGTLKEGYKGTLKTYTMLWHCDGCGVDLAGVWNHYFRRGSMRTSMLANEIEDFDNKIRKYEDFTPLLIKYGEEMNSFKDMMICPVCGTPLVKNEDNFLFSTGSDVNEICHSERDVVYTRISSRIYEHIGEGETFKYLQGNSTKHRYAKKVASDKAFLFYADDFDDVYRYFTSYKSDEIQSKVDERYNSTIELCNLPSTEVFAKVGNIQNDIEKLKKFIEQIIVTESNIYAVSERLKVLYRLHAENSLDINVSVMLYQRPFKEALEEAKKSYDNTCKEKTKLNKRPSVQVDERLFDFSREFPEPPDVPRKEKYPTKPSEPAYVKVNVFNRKKATAENEELKNKYESECKTYEEQCKLIDEKYKTEMEVYNRVIIEYDREVAEIERERRNKYEARVREVEKELEAESNKNKIKLKAALDEAQQKLDEVQQKYDEVVALGDAVVTPETVKQKIIEDEIVQAEALLKKLYSSLNAMYDSGVIFAKYRNFVACSTFSEYLESGRCTRLDGPDGAYNIYENESRMNMVVSQLSQVIESLEQIKQNQFIIYSAINETNKLLHAIDISTNKMVDVLGDLKADTSSMNSYLKDIANNTAVSAYYSQVNAFYAKKNAELTNSLGFMMAYK